MHACLEITHVIALLCFVVCPSMHTHHEAQQSDHMGILEAGVHETLLGQEERLHLAHA